MDYICQHLFQALTQTGKLTKSNGWNTFEEASAKDGTSYRALFCVRVGKTTIRATLEWPESPCWCK